MTAADETEKRSKQRFRPRNKDDVVWCDKLGSTPAFGFSFEPHLASSSSLLDAASSITNNMIEDNQKIKFTIDRIDQYSVSFTSFSGFNYTLDQTRASVVFQHRMRMRRQSGQPPLMVLESLPRPFSELLDDVVKRSLQLAELMPKINSRKLMRIGLMAITAVNYEELPPGILALLSYQNKAWRGDITSFQIQYTVSLGSTGSTSDRCIFTAARSEDDEEDLVTVQLDWQRSFSDGRSSTVRSLSSLADDCKKDALRYFESLGDGTGYNDSVYGRTT